MNILLFLSLDLFKLFFVNDQILITPDWGIDEGVIQRTLPKHKLSFKSISVLLALELLPKHNSVFHIQGFIAQSSHFLLNSSYPTSWQKSYLPSQVIWRRRAMNC